MIKNILKHLLIAIISIIAAQALFYYYLDDFIIRFVLLTFYTFLGLRLLLAYIFYVLISSIIKRKVYKQHIDIVAGLYLIIVIALSFIRGDARFTQYNLNPFSIINDFRISYTQTMVIFIANLFIYSPTGVYIKYRFNKSYSKILFMFLIYIIILELLQHILSRGVFDINDIITNTAGFIFGALIYGGIQSKLKR